MEEWRPIIVDSLVLSVFNLKALTLDDFRSGEVRQEDLEETVGDEFEGEDEKSSEADEELPVRLTDAGFRKFLAQFERKISQKASFHLTGQHFTYRDCITEQVRHFARYVRGEQERYQPMPMR
jgi:CRISPR-associated protein Cas1